MGTLISGRLAAGGRIREGWVEVEGNRIAAAGFGTPLEGPDVAHDGVVAAGLCDLQVNGAAGVEVTGGPAALDAIDALMLARGVTSYLAAIATTDDETAARAIADAAERAGDPASPLDGVHLEGPFVSPELPGIHRTELLRRPADGLPPYYGDPCVRLVTLAPELPAALDLVRELRRRDPPVAVSLGHSAADPEVAELAVAVGAGCVTHVFNAMRPLHHRDPGLAGWALAHDRVLVAAIADGFHLDPVALRLVRRAAGERLVLVSDASPAAGAPAGEYRVAGVDVVRSADGRVATAEGRLGGSGVTLDEAVRRFVLDTGAPLPEALCAASERPAALLGLPVGLRAGCRADLVLMTDAGEAQRAMRAGRWLD